MDQIKAVFVHGLLLDVALRPHSRTQVIHWGKLRNVPIDCTNPICKRGLVVVGPATFKRVKVPLAAIHVVDHLRINPA